ncbi:amidase [Sinomonas sp.]|uniref:amidase n=1 Tax=Sinomonas sp. TaxID=1914986 RepID=UPI003F7ED2A8
MNELVYLDAVELAAMIRSREVSAVELLEAHLDRIHALNPAINAVVTLDEEGARAAAADADRALAAGASVGPLHGLPIAFKDTARTRGLRTTFSHPRYADHLPDDDDPHVRSILAAGAIRLGKTNVPEHAAGSHTVNRVFGATRNPYDLSRSAGGSSGGAAASLAAGFQPIADGSDMGGSLRNPASFCNVVGLRPTPGLVPDDGPNDFFTLGVVGPMGRTARDTALLLGVMSVAPTSARFVAEVESAGCNGEDFRGLRVAFAPTLGGRVPVEREVLDVVERQAQLLEELGADVERACPNLDGSDEAFRTLRAAAFDSLWGDELAADPDLFTSFLAGNIRDGARLTGRDVVRAEEIVTRLARRADEFFGRFDLVIAPAAQVAPFPIELDFPTVVDGQQLETYLDWMRAAYLFTPLGIPGLSVPAGFTPSGLPVGLQMLTRRGSDVRLLRLAAAVEHVSPLGSRHPEGVAVL